MDFKLL